jgi:glutamine synthetase
MLSEELIFAATCDISGHVRGKAFPARELPARLLHGIGWTPTNIMISPLGPIWDTPFGTVGDLMLLPDPSTEVRVDFADGSAIEHFILGDLRHTDGTPWECCPREFLRRAIAALSEEGYQLHAAFEQEFVYTGAEAFAASPYSLGAFRQQGSFGAMLTGALRGAGLTPDTFLAEYGPRQFEVTVAPADALAAADHAIITRELARAAAFRLGHRAIFAPMVEPDGTGNGVHIHMSLRGKDRRPTTYESGQPYSLSAPAAHFFAGIISHLPALCAVTAPSPVSYLRLTPNRWAPTQADIAVQDRAASLRICPVFGATGDESVRDQFNVEYRTADAAASPYLALAAIIFAGVDGLRRKLELPPDASLASPPEPGAPISKRIGAPFGPRPLPRSLDAALDALEQTAAASGWFGPSHFSAYMRAKRAEAEHAKDDHPAVLCARYAAAY